MFVVMSWHVSSVTVQSVSALSELTNKMSSTETAIDMTDIKDGLPTTKPAKGGKGAKVSQPVEKAAPKSYARRDHLRTIEIKIQQLWEEKKIYEQNASIGQDKFFINFPYPYMNGRLHLGHAFSFTKAEFTARFQRLKGKAVLLPFAFHCTGKVLDLS